MDLQQLPQLESLCERLYTAQSQAERTQIEQMLGVFGQSTEHVPALKAILDNSRSPYAQLLASSSLTKLLAEHSLNPSVRTDMKNYFLQYLDSNCATLEHFVCSSLVTLLCRTAKLGWFDSDSHRAIVEDAKRFLEKGTPAHYLVGLRILNTIVQEMNQATPGRTLTQHRKAAVNFRDTALLRAFQVSYLSSAARGFAACGGLNLALACLSFDFVGTCLDESSEELCTIQVPSSWRPAVEDPATLQQLFLDLYSSCQPPLSSTSLECMVRLAGVRRSLFTSEGERLRFLNRLVAATRSILDPAARGRLAQHDNFHGLCRLLGRLKTNYQLSELVSVDSYNDWIQSVAQLTIYALQQWEWAGSSCYYLLGLWSRLVSSMPYLKGDSPSLLEGNVPNITQAYVTSRLESVQRCAANPSLDDMLDTEDALSEQLDALPYLMRYQYDRSAQYLTSLMDPACDYYKQASQQPLPGPQLSLLEGQLTWLVYITGAVIKGRLATSTNADSQEALDGDLASRVFALLRAADEGLHTSRYGERSRQRLDVAFLHFLQCFRKVYIGEQVMHSSKVYTRLAERLGLEDHAAVLSVMLAKIGTNLRVYGASEELVHLSLVLFQELAAGYMSGKLLMKLDAVSQLLVAHTSEHYAFLDAPGNGRNRTTYYATLARLLFMEDTPARFRAFVTPLHQLGQTVAAAPSVAALRQAVPVARVAGLFRDLRGIASATATRRTYGFMFEWLYPQHMPTVLKCLEAWSDVPALTTPLLKFIAEFCFNKSQRLTFDSSSPNGILLFREVSKVVVTYANRPAGATGGSAVYDTRYKGIWVCLLALARAMSGNYVNFGVFELYGDPALKDALEAALRMVLSVPLADLLAFRKLAKAYFALMEVLAAGHASVVAAQDTRTFVFLMSSLEMGLKSLDVSVSSSCASAVDNMASFFWRHVASAAAGHPETSVAQHPNIFPELLRALFEIVMFEECSNQWSLSRPMLALVLINGSMYNDIKAGLIASQPPERQAHLASCLNKLMVDVAPSLDPKNKDRFTQNLTVLRHEYRSKT
ncbi:hypothetical protein VOLCADRAFT_65225 [Volvox carteri f. nagariensis]|uniref:Uncharacterized protein mot59 n=1 Tax=Volvox carteri f. nagariensis TaxID=3068 RepID=D8U7Z8_VOLCA|nr:uncharacterized protein VOLCADRAFT_65225 [Volvox carteri f. nagariensis]EFJ44129.1 hypothetical protein VOLCADRAFT_65225 [Volvox carteri f. nagariensis]|eukprot:XP_002954723.1 hypothetical protein VOLCADRAFT_65225 [Volvox carteri f. nagariensis]